MFTTHFCFAVRIRVVPTLKDGNFVAPLPSVEVGTCHGAG